MPTGLNMKSNVTVISGGPATRRNFFAKNSELEIREMARRSNSVRRFFFFFEDEPPPGFRLPAAHSVGNARVTVNRLDELADRMRGLSVFEKNVIMQDFQQMIEEIEADAVIFFENPAGWIARFPAEWREPLRETLNRLIARAARARDARLLVTFAVNSLLEFSVLDELGSLAFAPVRDSYNYFLLPNPNDSFYPMIEETRGANFRELFITEVYYLPVGMQPIVMDVSRWLNSV